jgi:drug/metabolite transporter (DMT)-like permease
MWVRGTAGLIALVLGAVWVLQGLDVLHGSTMSGHGQYAGLGVVAILIGLAFFAWAVVVRRRRTTPPA